MRMFVLYATFLSSLAMAQGPAFTNQQWTTGFAGITPGQSAKLVVFYPTAPAPILQPTCTVTLNISDDQGQVLKSLVGSQITAGKSISIEVNGDTDVAGAARAEVYGFAIGSEGCNLVQSMELIDNSTQKTLLVVSGQKTYPITFVAPAGSSNANVH